MLTNVKKDGIIMLQNDQCKKGDYMTLNDIANIRTGLVTIRKKARESDELTCVYKLINLKCISSYGNLDLENAEEFISKEKLKPEYFTQKKDILVRLSAPYTAIQITREEECGYIVPSHFVIIRVDERKASSEYILWLLQRESTIKKILMNTSGSTAFGTISASFFSELKIRKLPLDKQRTIGGLLTLSNREQQLIQQLAEEKKKLYKASIQKIYDLEKRSSKK